MIYYKDKNLFKKRWEYADCMACVRITQKTLYAIPSQMTIISYKTAVVSHIWSKSHWLSSVCEIELGLSITSSYLVFWDKWKKWVTFMHQYVLSLKANQMLFQLLWFKQIAWEYDVLDHHLHSSVKWFLLQRNCLGGFLTQLELWSFSSGLPWDLS